VCEEGSALDGRLDPEQMEECTHSEKKCGEGRGEKKDVAVAEEGLV
jgi:hypothetical protein